MVTKKQHGKHAAEVAEEPREKHAPAHAAEEVESAAVPLGIGGFILAIVLVVNVLVPCLFAELEQKGAFELPFLSQSEPQTEQVESAEPDISYTPTINSLNRIPDSGKAFASFTLGKGEDAQEPELSDSQAAAIEDAIKVIEDTGASVDIVFMDLENGAGITYNCDEDIYGASSFKGAFCVWLAQEKLDTGLIDLDSVKSRIEPTVEYSDDNQYASLRNSFSNDELADWLEDMGLDRSIAYDTNYPFLTARESAQLWIHLYQYLFDDDNDSEYATWLKSLFTITNVSEIRDGIEAYEAASSEAQSAEADDAAEQFAGASADTQMPQEDSQDKVQLSQDSQDLPIVYNKAGWVSGHHTGAVVDAGIIEVDGQHYLMSILTSQFDSETARQNVVNLASALWASHPALSE